VLGLLTSQPGGSRYTATSQAALASYQKPLGDKSEEAPPGHGFRVWRTVKDPALGRQWFWIQACSDSPRPAQLLWAPLSLEKTSRDPVAPAVIEQQDHLLVHVGDAVVVTQASAAFSMRLAGHALQAGELGGKVRVQISAWHNTTVVAGKISGKDEVRLGE
jgi:hypothetical protein